MKVNKDHFDIGFLGFVLLCFATTMFCIGLIDTLKWFQAIPTRAYNRGFAAGRELGINEGMDLDHSIGKMIDQQPIEARDVCFNGC